MTDLRKISVVVGAPWLPPGSSAETWVGNTFPPAEPAVITRLLVIRQRQGHQPEFFCVPTMKGPNLPTRYLGDESVREPLVEGTSRLISEIFEQTDVATHCIGFIRNVVPAPDPSYVYPAPWANVPVFLVAGTAPPIVDGEWFNADRAGTELADRHWWPIVEHYLARNDA